MYESPIQTLMFIPILINRRGQRKGEYDLEKDQQSQPITPSL